MSNKKEQQKDKKTDESSFILEASKLGKLLNKLSKDELKSLSKFLRSPWFGVGEPTTRLYEKLVADLNQSPPSLTKVVLQKQLQLNPKALNKQMNALLMAVEKFLVQQALEQDRQLSMKLLMMAAKSHHAHDLFHKQVDGLLQATKLAPPSSPNGLHEPFLLEFEVYSALYLHPNTEKFKPKVETLHQVISSLDRYYVACKLFYVCEVFNRRLIVGEAMEVVGLDALVEFAQQPVFNGQPVFQLYLAVLDRLRFGRDDAKFEACLWMFGKNLDALGRTELQALLVFLINHANSVYKSGVTTYLPNIFKLYLLGIRHHLVDTDGQLSPSTFVNIVTTASLCHRFNFARAFIQQAQNFLPKAEKKPVVHVAMAFLCFHKGDFKEAYAHAYRSDLSSPRYALIAKPLLLRSCFEDLLGTGKPRSVSMLQANIEAFKQYIKRDGNLTPEAKKSYQQFARILRSMTTAISLGSISKRKREWLLSLLSPENLPFSKAWLEAKILSLP